MVTGKKLNKIVDTKAVHALYSKYGRWYHHLKAFPGVLFDDNGYIIFNSEKDYQNNSFLHHGKDLNIEGDISIIPGYIKFTPKEKSLIFKPT